MPLTILVNLFWRFLQSTMSNDYTILSKDQLNKIGNTIIYLANHVPDLNKTKILKLLYLVEEAAIKKSGKPFLGIDFQLWKYGPVAKDIYIDLTTQIFDDQLILLKNFIVRKGDNFVPKKEFDDSEFSDNDLLLLNKIVSFAKDKPATYLVKHTHGPHSLWRKSAIKYGVLEMLENELVNSTDLTIDFSLLFEDNPALQERYIEARENQQFVRQLKS